MRLTIGRKLNGLIAGLLLLSVTGVVVLAAQMMSSNLVDLLRKSTLDTSTMLSGRVRSEMRHIADRARMLGAASLETFQFNEDRLRFMRDNLAVDSEYVGLSLYRRSEGLNARFTAQWRIVNPEIAKRIQLSPTDFDQMDRDYPLELNAVAKGEVDFTSGKLKDGTPTLRMAIPFVQKADGSFSQLLVIELNQERLASLFTEAAGTNISYLIDRRGRVLGSTDPGKIPFGADLRQVPIVELRLKTGRPNNQKDFEDANGERQMAAYQEVGFAGLAVVTQAAYERALAARRIVYRRTSLLAAAFLSLALCLGFLFSQSLTRPIQALAGAARRVAEGDFSVRLATREQGDEVQEFSSTFNHMVSGLEERDRVKATFAKFHSKEVAEKLMSGEVNLGGERKSAAVFFSDVRGFTAMSEKMDPEALVRVLNRYMTRMVRVILENGGIVDKYVGDAIMAVWGVPLSKEDDCERAVRACIGMRQALAELNEELKAEGLPLLKIGMGLNYGPLVSGNIGSEERMEYTVIGDTVNTASRIESLTKEFGTDLLISQEVLERVNGRFIVEKAHEAKVKGKSEPLVIYKVWGFVNEDGTETRIETPYSTYTAEKSDKVVHDKAEEKKVEPGEPPEAAAIRAPNRAGSGPWPEHAHEAEAARGTGIAHGAEHRRDLFVTRPASLRAGFFGMEMIEQPAPTERTSDAGTEAGWEAIATTLSSQPAPALRAREAAPVMPPSPPPSVRLATSVAPVPSGPAETSRAAHSAPMAPSPHSDLAAPDNDPPPMDLATAVSAEVVTEAVDPQVAAIDPKYRRAPVPPPSPIGRLCPAPAEDEEKAA